MTSAPTHLDLVGIARAVRRAAVDEDAEGLHAQLARLRTSLVHHLHAERQRGSGARGSVEVVVGDGQQRLLRLLDDVIFDAGADEDGCNCLVRAAEIELALRRQAKLEAAVHGRRCSR